MNRLDPFHRKEAGAKEGHKIRGLKRLNLDIDFNCEGIKMRKTNKKSLMVFMIFTVGLILGGIYTSCTLNDPMRAEILELTDKFHNAEIRNDQEVLDQILDDDLVVLGINQVSSGKKEFINFLNHKDFAPETIVMHEPRILCEGNKAIVFFTFEMTANFAGERKANHKSKLIYVYEKRNDVWKLTLIKMLETNL